LFQKTTNPFIPYRPIPVSLGIFLIKIDFYLNNYLSNIYNDELFGTY